MGRANITPEHAQTLTDHLGELRDRLIKSVWAIVIMTAVCWFYSDQLVTIIAKPILPHLPNGKLVFLNPMDTFMAYMKVALMGGIVLSCPVWIYQIWRFVAPGLYDHERKYGLAFVGSGVLLFATGVCFAYLLVLPTGLEFLLSFGGESTQAMISVADYLSFFVTMILVFGASFELPLFIVILGFFGIVDPKFLRDKRRYAIVLLAFIAAVITPPDVLSMMMLLVPLMALYEISILVVAAVGRRRAPSSADQLNAPQ